MVGAKNISRKGSGRENKVEIPPFERCPPRHFPSLPALSRGGGWLTPLLAANISKVQPVHSAASVGGLSPIGGGRGGDAQTGRSHGASAAELRDVKVTPHPGAQIPLDLPFIDSNGRKVAPAEFLRRQAAGHSDDELLELPHVVQPSAQWVGLRDPGHAVGAGTRVSDHDREHRPGRIAPAGGADKAEVFEALWASWRGCRMAISDRRREKH